MKQDEHADPRGPHVHVLKVIAFIDAKPAKTKTRTRDGVGAVAGLTSRRYGAKPGASMRLIRSGFRISWLAIHASAFRTCSRPTASERSWPRKRRATAAWRYISPCSK